MKLRIGLLSLVTAAAAMAALLVPVGGAADGVVPISCPSLPAATPTSAPSGVFGSCPTPTPSSGNPGNRSNGGRVAQTGGNTTNTTNSSNNSNTSSETLQTSSATSTSQGWPEDAHLTLDPAQMFATSTGALTNRPGRSGISGLWGLALLLALSFLLLLLALAVLLGWIPVALARRR
jgi:hypothetical protein